MDPKALGSLYDGPLIARGAFGVVRLCHSSTLGLCAVKSIPLPSEEEWLAIRREARALELASGPTTVRLLGLQRLEPSAERPVPIGLLVMEYVSGGTLANLAQNWRPGTGRGIPEGLLKRYVRELVKAIAHVHARGMAHRDLKGANVMLAVESQGVKLADFGSCKLPPSVSDELDAGDASPNDGVGTHLRPTTAISVHGVQRSLVHKENGGGGGSNRGEVGTIAWMAPEVVNRSRSSSKVIGRGGSSSSSTSGATVKSLAFWQAADVWGLGCTVLELATGRPPWHGEAEEASEIMLCIASQDLRERLPSWISPNTRSFLNACLNPSPDARPKAAGLLEHPFLQGDDYSDDHPESLPSEEEQQHRLGSPQGRAGTRTTSAAGVVVVGGSKTPISTPQRGSAVTKAGTFSSPSTMKGGVNTPPHLSSSLSTPLSLLSLLSSPIHSVPSLSLAAALRTCDTLKSEVRLSCRQVQHWDLGTFFL